MKLSAVSITAVIGLATAIAQAPSSNKGLTPAEILQKPELKGFESNCFEIIRNVVSCQFINRKGPEQLSALCEKRGCERCSLNLVNNDTDLGFVHCAVSKQIEARAERPQGPQGTQGTVSGQPQGPKDTVGGKPQGPQLLESPLKPRYLTFMMCRSNGVGKRTCRGMMTRCVNDAKKVNLPSPPNEVFACVQRKIQEKTGEKSGQRA